MKTIFKFLIIVLVLLFGIAIGFSLGVTTGQKTLLNGIVNIFSNSNITVDINETNLIEEVKQKLMPEFFNRLKDMEMI